MSILSIPFDPDGAIVTIALAVSGPRQAAMRAAQQPVPSPVVARGLLDTGASCTCVDPSLIQRLGLTPSGTTSISTPSTGIQPVVCNQYDVALAIVMDEGQVHLTSLMIPVVESDLGSQGIQALIGRDVLDLGVMIYDGRRRHLTLAF